MNQSNDQSRYWESTLRGFTVPSPLTIDKGGKTVSATFSEFKSVLDSKLWQRLQSSLTNAGVELETVFQGVWALLLYRYGAGDELVFGYTPQQGKINAVPLRCEITASSLPIDWLAELQHKQKSARDYYDTPYEVVRSYSEFDDELPLFYSLMDLSDDGLAQNFITSVGCPLVVRPELLNNELSITIRYDKQRINPAQAERIPGHLGMLLEGIAENENDIAHINLLTEDELQQVVYAWNDTKSDYPDDACLHTLFERHADTKPDSHAIYFGSEAVSYKELDAKANKLANYLIQNGVGLESMVGISTNRSIEMIVGILGILKAGAAYVPIDPSYPRDRLAFMLKDTHVPVLLTQQSLLETLPELEASVICLDSDWDKIDSCSDARPDIEITPDNLAYIIYTSGSTGRPKGIVLQHRGVVNNIFDLNQVCHVNEQARIMAISSLSFDMCVYETLGTLSAGGAIVMPDPHKAKDPAHWARLVKQHGVTLWNSAPQLLEMLLDYAESHPEYKPETITACILGGDWCPLTLPERFRTQTNGGMVVVLGGATELSIHSTITVVDEVQPHWKSIPYGKPMKNQKAYVLDQNLQPVPVGVPGELHLGGIGLARGYFEQPELTSQKFIVNPFAEQKGERFYKTGDLVKWREDGLLELLGRIDFQVKVRGHRIELGEISSVIRNNDSVEDCVVVMREDQPGDRRLVAYLVANQSDQESQEKGTLTKDQVNQWESIYDETYQKPSPVDDPTQNFVGWNSSYTGLPFPEAQLREMMDETVNRILALKPRKVLEIGCGTGLVLFRVAPHCEQYDASDLSQEGINAIKRQMSSLKQPLDNVNLSQRMADNFDGVPDNHYDLIIINSVIQHFPDIHYLRRVIEGAAKKLCDGGRIFIGDIRSYPLLESFNSSVELFRSPDSLPLNQLRERIKRKIKNEKELSIAPEFLSALRDHVSGLKHVAIRLKKGVYKNEFNQFHFDAVIYFNQKATQVKPESWLDWKQVAQKTLAEQIKKQAVVGIRNIPNARIYRDVQLVRLLKEGESINNVAELKCQLDSEQYNAIEPQELVKIAAGLNKKVELSYSEKPDDGTMQAVFHDLDEGMLIGGSPALSSQVDLHFSKLSNYANDPTRTGMEDTLIPQIKSALKEKLPEYMVPQDYVILDALPLTPNGKVDRRSLPMPEYIRTGLDTEFVAPETDVETVISQIWSEILSLEEVGMDDNFFDLGGHSLKATQIVTRINEIFQINSALADIFDYPTIRKLSERLQSIGKQQSIDVDQVAEAYIELNSMSEEEMLQLLQSQG